MLKLTFFLLITLCITSCGSSKSVIQSYYDCVLDSLGTNMDSDAQRNIKIFCAKKYHRVVPESVREKVVGSAQFTNFSFDIVGTINNRNENWLISEVKIQIDQTTQGKTKNYSYIVTLDQIVDATSSGEFYVLTNTDFTRKENFEWRIIEAKGIQID